MKTPNGWERGSVITEILLTKNPNLSYNIEPMDNLRVILDSDARRYNCRGTLYDFDALDHSLSPKAKLDFVNPVPVYSENRRGAPVGYADVYIEDNELKADLFIDYACPERLMMEIGEPVVAVPDGDFSVTSRNVVDALWVPHIMLGGHRRYDGIGGTVTPAN